MNAPIAGRTLFLVAALLCPATAARAQQNDPHIGYIYPAGGQLGTGFEILIGGQRLAGVSGAYISGSGAQAEVLEYIKPLTRKQQNELREQLRRLRPRGGITKQSDDGPIMWRGLNLSEMSRDELLELRKKLSNKKKQRNSQIVEVARLWVELEPTALPGERELRLRTPAGLSNPMRFQVDRWEEVLEQESNNPPLESGPAASPPVILNGQILPGDIDRFRFEARKGQRLVAAARARALIPYLADAVPGWFQATLTLYDDQGRQLTFVDDYRFHPDPVLFFEIEHDGEYQLEIRDAIYRGREDFVYRIALGELPFVTSSFPLGGQAGQTTEVSLVGWNLPQEHLAMAAGPEQTGGTLLSGPVRFVTGSLPEALEQEPNQGPESSQQLALPLVVNGRVDQPGDQDVFRIEGHRGDRLVAEVQARRLDSPLDSVLTLTDSQGARIAMNDDHDDRGAGLTTHQADSLLTATLPSDGSYFLALRDAQAKGGPAYAYRLRVGPPRPDFTLRVVPSSINVPAGGTVPLTVYALRRDGFLGEIRLELEGAPDGFLLSGGVVPAGHEKIRITLSAPFGSRPEPIRLTVLGHARIGEEECVRTAVAADDLMQAFLYRHLVPAQELLVAVSSRKGPRIPARRLVRSRVTLTPGGTVELPLPATPRLPIDRLRLELSDPPEGISLQEVRRERGRLTLVLHADAKRVQPGLQGNLIVNLSIERSGKRKSTKKPQGRKRRNPLGSLPAIRFEVVAAREI